MSAKVRDTSRQFRPIQAHITSSIIARFLPASENAHALCLAIDQLQFWSREEVDQGLGKGLPHRVSGSLNGNGSHGYVGVMGGFELVAQMVYLDGYLARLIADFQQQDVMQIIHAGPVVHGLASLRVGA